MIKCAPLGSLIVLFSAAFAWGQKPSESAATTVVTKHDIPADNLGNVVRITGSCNPKSETRPNGYFEIRISLRRGPRGVQAISGKLAVSGAVIDRSDVESIRMIKSTVDHVAVNDRAVDFGTHSQDGALKLRLVADKDAQVVVALQLETANGPVAFRYFLNPNGLSAEPVKKKEAKK